MTSRPLTEEEIALARNVFGDSIDYSAVRIHDRKYLPMQSDHDFLIPNNNMYMYRKYEDDYTRGDSALLICSLTHVWQFQNKILDPVAASLEIGAKKVLSHVFKQDAGSVKNVLQGMYTFKLEEGKDITDYDLWQQAGIITTLFELKCMGYSSFSHCTNACDDGEKQRLLMLVTENFIKNPSYARQSEFPKASQPKLTWAEKETKKREEKEAADRALVESRQMNLKDPAKRRAIKILPRHKGGGGTDTP